MDMNSDITKLNVKKKTTNGLIIALVAVGTLTLGMGAYILLDKTIFSKAEQCKTASTSACDNYSESNDSTVGGDNNYGYEPGPAPEQPSDNATDLTELPADTDLSKLQVTSDVASKAEQAEILALFKTIYGWIDETSTRIILENDGVVDFSDNYVVSDVSCLLNYPNDAPGSTKEYKDYNGNDVTAAEGMIIKAQTIKDFAKKYFNKTLDFERTKVLTYFCGTYIPELDSFSIGGIGGGRDHYTQQLKNPVITKDGKYYVLNVDYSEYIKIDGSVVEKPNKLLVYFEKISENGESRFVVALTRHGFYY